MHSAITHTWQSQVRDYELDSHSIVNNANYLHYFEEARTQFFNDNNSINLDEWDKRGYIFVLAKTEVTFMKPLLRSMKFCVLTQMKIEKVKINFMQTIINEKGEEHTRAHSLVVCVQKLNGKPCFPAELKLALSTLK